MDKQIVFKTSTIGGFEKKAVLDYIYTLIEDHAAALSRLRDQAAGFEAANAAQAETLRQTAEQLTLAKSELEGTRADLARERGRAVDLDSANESLQGEIARQRERIAQMQSEIELLRREASELREDNSRLMERQSKLDRDIASAGKLMFDARNDASNILSQAQREAEDAAGRILADAERVREDADAEAGRIIDEAAAKAELLTRQSILSTEDVYTELMSFKTELSGIQEHFSDLMSSVEASGLGLLKIRDTITAADLSESPDSENPENFFRDAASVQ
ncbi:MAG: hypothetical protein FWH00_04600 [Oscillospiraceae bacterium]|nr:hypothetical protein [Oscillospiraceae bacterium]